MRQIIPETTPDYDRTRIIERPDGFHWQARDTPEEFGPFATLLEAVQDMQYRDGRELETGETLAEAEADLGLSDWVDPDTGELAEEGPPRLEDH